jgi:replicative DNA helicase
MSLEKNTAPHQVATGFQAKFVSSSEFSKTKYDRRFVVQQLLLPGQLAVVGGAKKSMKTSVAIDLAVSLGTGTPFLNEFSVPKAVSVALLSGESGAAALQDIAGRVCAARDVRLKDCDVRWCFKLPRLDSPADLRRLGDYLDGERVGVAIIDPLYLCLLGAGRGASASNLYEVGPVLMRAAAACLDAGATPVLVHHSTKSGGKKAETGSVPDLDDLAFAGVGEFARQWMLLGRREPYRPGSGRHRLTMNAGGSSGHSGLWSVDIDEGVPGGAGGRTWRVAVRTGSEDGSGAASGGIDLS